MSAGAFQNEIYVDNFGNFYPISIQPETLTLTLGGEANVAAAGPLVPNLPSVAVSRGRRTLGVNARLVRFRFSGTLPPGYQANSILTLPVLTVAAFNAYGKTTVGTYTLNGTSYDIAFVGKTAEKIN